MNTNHDEKSFSYTYSAKEQSEIRHIRAKYLPPEEDKMARIRRLDASVQSRACMLSLIIGILGALVLGVGMCCVLVWSLYFLGIPVGVLGLGIAATAYPIYRVVERRERERVAPEILRLSEELLK